MSLSFLHPLLSVLVFLAQEVPQFPVGDPGAGGGGGSQQGGGGLLGMLPFFVLIGVFMWLAVIKPQKAKENEEKQLLEKLKKNDHVVTKGGMYGVVMNVKDDEVVLKIDEQQNVKVRFQKSAIAAILGEEDKSKTEEKKA
ncbi:MAG: preprotein translocase subunit YajC [Planctomycetota bacterium]